MATVLSRRTFLGLAGAASVGVLVAACGPKPTPEKVVETVIVAGTPQVIERVVTAVPVPEKKKVQIYTLAWQPACVEAMAKAVEDWNTANKDRIEIEHIQGGWGQVRDYLTTSIAGGVAPEVVQGITMWANEYGAQGAYLDLTDLIKGCDLGTDLHPTALDAAVSPLTGKIFCVPFCWETGMMYINADRFRDKGATVPEKGWTWEEFLAAGKKVTNPPEYYGLAANLSATQTTEDIIAWMWQTGAMVLGEKEGKWQVDLEPAREALTVWHDMLWKDQIVSQDSFGGTNILEAFPIGTYSIVQTGCFARGVIKSGEPPFEWRMVPLPYYKRHANSSEPQTWSLVTQAKVRGTAEAGWEVIQWMTNVPNSANIAHGDWLFPTRRSAMMDERFTTTEDDWSLALAELEYGVAYPKHPGWAEFDERVLGPNIQKYLQNELSLDELINLAYDEGSKILQRYETVS